MYTIGVVSSVPQPVVVNRWLRNVPSKGIHNWEPGAYFGIYSPDTFWYQEAECTRACERADRRRCSTTWYAASW